VAEDRCCAARHRFEPTSDHCLGLPSIHADAERGNAPTGRADVPLQALRGTAADYDRFRLPYAEALVELVRAELALDGKGMLVDLGTGTGQVARALRPFFTRVVAVDDEPDMVEYGRTRTERDDDGIEWRLGRAEDVEFPTGSIDVVASGNAFHRFDRPLVTAKASRWLSPDGVIVVLWSNGPMRRDEPWQRELSRVIDEWLARSGAGERIPAGWERNEYTDDVVLRDAGFDRQVERTTTLRHAWSVDAILGFLHATSFASRAALQEQLDRFDADVRDVLLGVDPSGMFNQDVTFGARFARR
jgi:SAM-dependent methyltransferase